jgi:sec-independent protein translocase protein TatA
MPIGVPELLIILVIVLLLFGARRLPEVARGLGSGMREFKDAVTGKSEEPEERPALARAEAQHPVAAEPPPIVPAPAEQPPVEGEVTSERRA